MVIKIVAIITIIVIILTGCSKSSEQLYEGSNVLVSDMNYTEAIVELETLVEKYPKDSLAAVAQYQIAQIYLDKINDIEVGLESLKTVIDNFPNSTQAKRAKQDIQYFPDWLMNKAESSRTAKDVSLSIQILEYIIEKYAMIDIAPKAQYLIGDINMNDLRDFKAAINSYRKVIDNFQGSSQEAHATFMIGYIYANILNDYENAKIEYNNFLKNYPKHELIPSIQFELEFIGKDINEIPSLQHIAS